LATDRARERVFVPTDGEFLSTLPPLNDVEK
jgi:hypothetical protein